MSASKANLKRRVVELEATVARYAMAINVVMLDLQDPDLPVDRDRLWRVLSDATGSCGM